MKDRTQKLKTFPRMPAAPLVDDLSRAKVPAVAVLAFLRQFTALFASGVPIVRALEVVQPQPEFPLLEKVIGQILYRLESGSSLSFAFAQYPRVFSRVAVTMVQVGEKSGRLVVALQRLISSLEQDERILRRIRSALTYPAIILVVTLGLSVALMFFVMPAFLGIFASLKADLPIITRLVWGATVAVRHPVFWIVLIVALEGLHYKIRGLRQSEQGSVFLHGILQSTPLFGGIVYHCGLARYCLAAEALLAGGHGLIKTLALAAEASGSPILVHDGPSISRAIASGETVSQYMKMRPAVYSTTITQMLAAGEEASSFSQMFQHAAHYHELEMETRVDLLAVSLEPILLMFVALIIGTILVATFLPLYGTLSKL